MLWKRKRLLVLCYAYIERGYPAFTFVAALKITDTLLVRSLQPFRTGKIKGTLDLIQKSKVLYLSGCVAHTEVNFKGFDGTCAILLLNLYA